MSRWTLDLQASFHPSQDTAAWVAMDIPITLQQMHWIVSLREVEELLLLMTLPTFLCDLWRALEIRISLVSSCSFTVGEIFSLYASWIVSCFIISIGICHNCGQKVVGERTGCTAMEKVYHIRCFTCFVCSEDSLLHFQSVRYKTASMLIMICDFLQTKSFRASHSIQWMGSHTVKKIIWYVVDSSFH